MCRQGYACSIATQSRTTPAGERWRSRATGSTTPLMSGSGSPWNPPPSGSGCPQRSRDGRPVEARAPWTAGWGKSPMHDRNARQDATPMLPCGATCLFSAVAYLSGRMSDKPPHLAHRLRCFRHSRGATACGSLCPSVLVHPVTRGSGGGRGTRCTTHPRGHGKELVGSLPAGVLVAAQKLHKLLPGHGWNERRRKISVTNRHYV